MRINSNFDFNQLSEWLKLNLCEENSITPHVDEIPVIPSKGIYFWFMHPDGYKKLSKYVRIQPVVPKHSQFIHNTGYDLIYLGSAGTGKQKRSTLSERLKWHINQKYSLSSVKSGALSTLRQGIGALLSEHLIFPNTQEDVNTFMQKYLKVFWLAYPNNNQLIDSEEEILIQKLNPLFNLKKNPNALKAANNNPTRIYKLRRKHILSKSKLIKF